MITYEIAKTDAFYWLIVGSFEKHFFGEGFMGITFIVKHHHKRLRRLLLI